MDTLPSAVSFPLPGSSDLHRLETCAARLHGQFITVITPLPSSQACFLVISPAYHSLFLSHPDVNYPGRFPRQRRACAWLLAFTGQRSAAWALPAPCFGSPASWLLLLRCVHPASRLAAAPLRAGCAARAGRRLPDYDWRRRPGRHLFSCI